MGQLIDTTASDLCCVHELHPNQARPVGQGETGSGLAMANNDTINEVDATGLRYKSKVNGFPVTAHPNP